jgi:hypothetical protein
LSDFARLFLQFIIALNAVKGILSDISNPTMSTGLDFKSVQFDLIGGNGVSGIIM